MSIYIGLVRGINVGARQMLPMAELRKLCESIGLKSVKTYLQSGNVIFETSRKDRGKLSKEIAAAIQAAVKIDVTVILRTPDELRKTMDANPLTGMDKRKPSAVVVIFLSDEPPRRAINALRAAYDGPEEWEVRRSEMYVDYKEGMGRSKLTNALIENKLGVRGTARNWNTVGALAQTESD
jgi:uncharacterized protein (DUF1697 family)